MHKYDYIENKITINIWYYKKICLPLYADT